MREEEEAWRKRTWETPTSLPTSTQFSIQYNFDNYLMNTLVAGLKILIRKQTNTKKIMSDETFVS